MKSISRLVLHMLIEFSSVVIREFGFPTQENNLKITVKLFGRFNYSFYICRVNQKTNDMNQIKEEINYKEASCREMNFDELIALLKSDIMKWWSWGAHNIRIDKKNGMKMMRFNVQGHHHKGHVYIFLNGLDLFDVYLTKTNGIIKDRTPEMGLYFDQLVDWIDERVERIPEYTH